MPKVMTRLRRERIKKVQEMVENGVKLSDIAQYFGISERMVYLDLKDAKKLHAELVKGSDSTEVLGGEIRYWLKVSRRAMRDYHFATNDNAKIGFLRVAIEARAKFNKLLQDTGLITTVPTRISLEEGNPFSDAEFRKEYAALMKKAREKGIKIHGL
jgi:hypothetical protein